MKKSIVSSLALLLALSACSKPADNPNNPSEEVYRNDYTYVYSTDPKTFDYTFTGYATDSDHLANFVDGLLEVDNYGITVGALADPENPYEYNEDFTEITFHLRQGIKWYTNEGEEYAEVKAQDFVTGLQHAIDFKSQADYLIYGTIKNAAEYHAGTKDFSEVGVEAVDDYTLKYTFEASTPYFHSMTTYGTYYPINQGFLESKGEGCKLGAPDPANCTFGSTEPTSILYNGAYYLTNFTAKSVIEYTANPEYYDKEHVFIDKVKLIYSDGTDPDSYFRGFDNGEYVSAPVYMDNEATFKEAQEKYGDAMYNTKTTSTSFYMSFNLDRNAFHVDGNEDAVKTTKNEKQIADTKKAVLNENFRKAIMFAWDRPTMSAQRAGEQLKMNAIRNTITMPEFVTLSDGTPYYELVADALAEIDPYWEGVDLQDGVDPYYNPERAKEFAAKAKEELAAQGVEFPIVIEKVVDQSEEKTIRMSQSMAASIEANLGSDFIKVVSVLADSENALFADYWASYGYQKDMDFSTQVGWGPDYADPNTYLNIIDPDTGAILSNIGLDYPGEGVGDDEAAKQAVGLYDYQKLINEANAILDDNDARYKAFAKAEAWVLNNAILIPYQSQGGTYAVSKVLPYTTPYVHYGITGSKYKYLQVSDHVISNEEREGLKKAWEEERKARIAAEAAK